MCFDADCFCISMYGTVSPCQQPSVRVLEVLTFGGVKRGAALQASDSAEYTASTTHERPFITVQVLQISRGIFPHDRTVFLSR